MKLLLLHHAGGDKYAYNNLNKQLNSLSYLCLRYELSGRSDRYSESLNDNLQETINELEQFIKHHIKPNEAYAIIGLSMGALLAYLVSHQLKTNDSYTPKMLFLASRMSLGSYSINKNYAAMSSSTFWQYILKYGGFSDSFLQHQELKKFYEPILRNDFNLLNQFNSFCINEFSLAIPTYIIFGKEDSTIHKQGINDWKNYFSNTIEINAFNGGHFFLYEASDEVVHHINNKIKTYD